MSDQKTPENQNVVANDLDLLRKVERLEAQVKVREDQLKQAIDIANKANDQQKVRDEAEKIDLIERIVVDSNRKFTPSELADKSLRELNLIKLAIDKSLDATFASVAALQAEQNRKNQPLLTAGAWDNKSQSWVGGI
ncbi:MAG: hypothetical protein WC325_12120 [Candidatus Bathyarchaeia archaeon]|jgi:LPS O-antigen subunit length determinant protein (WzzB/FepE family)